MDSPFWLNLFLNHYSMKKYKDLHHFCLLLLMWYYCHYKWLLYLQIPDKVPDLK